MRRSVLKKGQDICFFCALRIEASPYIATTRAPRQIRSYQSSTPSWRPAGAAAARREDDDDNLWAASSRSEPTSLYWRCKCGHHNLPRRSECTICSTLKPSGAQLVEKPVPISRPAPQSRPPTAQSPPSSAQSPFGSNAPGSSLASKLTGAPSPRSAPQARAAAAPEFGRSQRDDRRYPQNERVPQSGAGPAEPRMRFGGFGQIKTQTLEHSQGRSSTFGGRTDSPYSNAQRPYEPRSSVDRERSQFGRFGRDAPRVAPEGAERPSRFGAFVDGRMREPRPPARPYEQRSSDSFASNDGYRNPTRTGDQADMGRGSYRLGRDQPPLGLRPGETRQTTPLGRGLNQPAEEEFVSFTPLAEPIAEGEEDDAEFGRPRRGEKQGGRQSDKRRERFELEDDIDIAPTRDAKNERGRRGRVDPRTTAYEIEMAELEDRLEGRMKKKKKPAKKPAVRTAKSRVQIPEFISVENLAKELDVKLNKFLSHLEEEGFEGARYDHILDSQTSAMFAESYGFEPVLLENDTRKDIVARPPAEDPASLPQRPPIVTIMGHVDHGKTTILDWLRKSSVVASEHGGITQHIGAFSVTMPGTQRSITFLDTPGHAAFLDMRRRGANVTDIVVLVVAADDSVKPQTIEAIKHAKQAGVQIIVAINKVDKQDANIEKVKQDLATQEITVEDYGGEYQAIPLSGKTGQGMEELEEAIITLADVSDYRAETDGPAEGSIIESKVTAGGRVATILVRRGTLRLGDFIVAGNTWARVRTLRDDSGQLISEAPPGTPVQVDGWRGEDPTAGLEVLQANDEQHAKDVVELRTEKIEIMKTAAEMAALNASKTEAGEARAKVLEWEKEQGWKLGKIRAGRPWDNEGWVEPTTSSGPTRVHFVIKADVAGSVEAIVAAVSAIGNNEVVSNVVHSGTGHLGESDIRLLAGTGEVSYAINFNQPVEGTIHRLAEAANVQILDHNIIYKVTDQVKEKLADELPPLVTQKVLGEAEVGQIFEITLKKGKLKIAGCKVTNGTISRSQKVRVLRDNDVIFTGNLDSLKNVKKDVTDMRKGTECGMSFNGWEDMINGDKIQCFEEIKEKRKLY